MPIKKEIQASKPGSGSTHLPNSETVAIVDNEQEVLNHMGVDTLIDPEEDKGGSTHTSASVTASAKSTTVDDELPEDGNVITASSDPEEDDEEPLEEDEEVDASFETGDSADELENQLTPSELTADDDWDAEPEDDADEFVSDDEEEAAPDEGVDSDSDEDEVEASADDMPMLDVDDTPDDEVDNVLFASFGTKLMVIKANRIIAQMTKTGATQAKCQDVYLSDQFQEVTASEMTKQGLRKGLTTMGFTLAKVNVTKPATINARVSREVQKTNAALRKVQASKEGAFTQAMAIAAVGINRQYFKDAPNELKAALEAELQAAGVRNGGRIVARAFAEHGPGYAKAMVTLANKLAAMPQEVRDHYVSALDMTSDNADTEMDEIPIGADFDEDFDDESEVTSVTASLATPGAPRQSQSAVVANATGYSVTAASILNGERPLF